MSSGLIDIIKRTALNAVENSKPSDLKYGTVISDSPVVVRITNQFVIPTSMLIIPRYLTDYEIEVTVKPGYNWETNGESGGSSYDSFADHKHDISFDKKVIKVHAALKVGDKVVMVRQAGGQRFFILDKLVD